MGVFSDQKRREVNSVVWRSTRTDVLSIDKNTGLATVGKVEGTSTIWATDVVSPDLEPPLVVRPMSP
jgi:hypothetical protein